MAMQVSTGAEVSCTFGASPAVFSASGEDVAATTPAGVVTDVEPDEASVPVQPSLPVPPVAVQASPEAELQVRETGTFTTDVEEAAVNDVGVGLPTVTCVDA